MYVKKCVQKEYEKGTDLSGLDWMTIENGTVTKVDFDKYIRFRTRMKATPAFDNVSMGTPENELFGTPDTKYRHFTAFSKEHSAVKGVDVELQYPWGMPHAGDYDLEELFAWIDKICG